MEGKILVMVSDAVEVGKNYPMTLSNLRLTFDFQDTYSISYTFHPCFFFQLSFESHRMYRREYNGNRISQVGIHVHLLRKPDISTCIAMS